MRLQICALTACLSLAAAPVIAQTPQQLNWCNGQGTADLQISGCTAVIESGHFTGKNLAIAFNLRGGAYLDKYQYDRAIQDFGEAIRLDPQDTDAFHNRAIAYKGKGQYDRAIQDYDQIIRLDPNSFGAFNLRGEAYQFMGKLDRAIQDFDEAIRLKPQDARGFNNRAAAYHSKHQYDRSIQDFDQAIRLNPRDAQAWRNRGFVKKEKGDVAGGDADLAKAKALEAAH